MSALHFENGWAFWLLWAVPALAGAFAYAGWRRRQALERFADAKLVPRLNPTLSPARRRGKAVLLLAAFVLLLVAAARPAWTAKPKTVERLGRDVVFVLDVSRSMLAEDLAPNRIERAKIALGDCVDRLRGDRVGLVVFAGNAVVKCPLTLDYGFFKTMLSDVSTTSVGRGGTMIGDALRQALGEVFDDQHKEFKDIILITDGEDHDSFPLEAAAEVGKRGIRLLAVGIGDERQGKRIPITDEHGTKTFLTYQGEEVWSKLDAETLRKMVNATPGGRYLNVATGTIDLGDVYLRLVDQADKKALEAQTFTRYEERFQLFVGLAFVLLSAELLLGERRRRLEPST